MSYCHARISSGSIVSNASISPCGMEKGLCEKSTFLLSSSYSYIGKSTIQQNLNTSCSISPSTSPTRVRAAPASLAACNSLPAAKKTPSLGPRPSASINFAVFSSPRSEEHTSELQSLMPISYAFFCFKQQNNPPFHLQT